MAHTGSGRGSYGNGEPNLPQQDSMTLSNSWVSGMPYASKAGAEPSEGSATKWLRKNLTDLERLQGRVLYSLVPEDFQHILEISTSFRDCGAPPTTFGKALHFFLPETVMMWDQAIVRNTYKLRPDPESFARTVGYFEPVPMVLDHLAFSPKLSARAVGALGGPSKAFCDDISG